MKYLLILLCVGGLFAANGQTTATAISDIIRTPVNNTLFTGTVTFIPSHNMTCGDNAYLPQPVSVTVTKGVLSTALVPNASCLPVDSEGEPATYYTARWVASRFTMIETLVVPVSATPVSLSALRAAIPSAATVMISPSQISAAGATTGQGLVFNGDNWVAGTITAEVGPHASTHAAAGSDPITIAQSQVTDLTTALGAKAGYPGAGVPNSAGSAWGTSYVVGTSANNLVQLNESGQLPAVSAANLTNFPTLNQSTTGTAAGLTSQYIDWNASSGGSSIANKPAAYSLPTASADTLGGVKVGSGLGITDGVLAVGTLNQNTTGTAAGLAAQYIDWNASSGGTSIANKPAAYSLPTATDSVLGGVKVGSGLTMTDGVLAVGTLNQSTTGNAATASTLATARTIFGVSFDGSANIGSRSGNTSEMATVSGTKTVDKQLKFDASGNIVASTTDIGAGTGGSSLANVLGSENTATLSSWGTLAAVGSAGNCVAKNISFTGVVSGARLILGVPSALPATVIAKVTPGTDLAVVTLCNVGNAAVSADLDGTYTVTRLEVLE
jgi:hypothetical protein